MHTTLKLGEEERTKGTRNAGKLDSSFLQLQKHVAESLDIISRHQRIKIQAWLKKLDMRMENVVWKQNRNFYMKVLHEMILARDIQEPFNKVPPEGPLPTLSPYDVPYPLRTKFLNNSEKEHRHVSQHISKNNSLEGSFVSTKKVSINELNKENIGWNDNANQPTGRESDLPKRSQRHNSRDPAQRKRERNFFADTNRRISFNDGPSQRCEDKTFSPQQQGVAEAETLRKELFRKVGLDKQPREDVSCKSNNSHTEELMEAKTFSLLKRTFKFLLRNYDSLQDQQDYRTLIEDVIRLGDEKKVDLRNLNVELSPSPSKMVFKKYSSRIKEKLESSGEESKEFLQFLSVLRKRCSS